MKPTLAVPLKFFAHSFILLNILVALNSADSVFAQPRPRPTPTDLKPPVRLLSVALNSGAMHLFHRLGDLPTEMPAFVLPRNPSAGGLFVLEFQTRDGTGTIHFSHSTPDGVQANAFQWLEDSGSPPRATARLRYNLCNNCPGSFLLTVTATDGLDFRNPPRTEQVRITLTASGAAARIENIRPEGLDHIRQQFRITFAPLSFNEEDSHAEVRYAGGLRYRLVPQEITDRTMLVVVERLKVSRNVRVFLSNPLGGSDREIEIPSQPGEGNPFEPINSSNCWTCGTFTEVPPDGSFSVQHARYYPGIASATDTIPLSPERRKPQCDKDDFIFTTARIAILRVDRPTNPPVGGPGGAKITKHPPKNHFLREGSNEIKVKWWKPGYVGDWWYQVVPNGITVVGVCSDRIVH